MLKPLLENCDNVDDSKNIIVANLQNIYTNKDVQNQSMSIALAVSEMTLKDHGVCRVHGGGFAGTIQAFVPNELLDTYKQAIESVFGEGSCYVLSIRPLGGTEV